MTFKKYDLLEAIWQNKYYGNLIDCKIVGVKAEIDEYTTGVWPVLVLQDKSGSEFEVTLSRDPEGNGPGFMFGLPEVSTEEDIERVNRMTNEEIEDLYEKMVHVYE